MDALVLVRSQAKPHANSCQFGSSMELVLDTCLDLAAPAQTHSIDLSAANADHDHEPNQNTGGIRLTRALDGVYAVHGVSVYSVLDTVAEKMCEIDDIRCLVTSPCLELVVVATPTATLLLTHALMQIATLDSDRAPESDALGWGSAKTQFKGKKNQEVVLNAGVGVASVDDGMPRVAWRGDGKYFAVSTFESNRRILVYSRQGVLVHAAEPIPGLGQALCWKPAGDLFASAQKLAHVHRVVFYELNGLRHGGFDLQNPESRVLEMAFSCDSSILALLLEIPTTDRAGVQITRSVIQLWTSSNYAWYLAYELAPQTPSTTFTSFLWHPESPLVLVTTESAQYMTLQHEFVRHVFASTATGTSNRGVVGVVNGKNADFTPFRDRNVPPPMKWGASVHKSNVLYIAFGPGPLPKPNAEIGESVDVAVLLADMSVDFYGGVQTRAPVFLFSIDSLQTSSFTARQILWVRPGVLIALGFDSHEQRDKLFVVTFAQQDKCTTANILHRVEVELPEDLMLIHHDENSGGVMVETVSGSILVLEEASSDKDADGTRPDNNGMWTLEFHCQFATPCIKIATLFVGHASNNSRENRLFACVGLTDRNKLYVDSHVLSQDCTSFYVHDTHLIVSTLEHVARFYPTTVTSILGIILLIQILSGRSVIVHECN